MKPLRRVAVLGAGTMGSRIAAHFANPGLPVDLLDIVIPDQPKRNAAALAGVENAAKQKPVAFFTDAAMRLIAPGNFEDDLGRLRQCDWIVEAVSENLEIKRSLFERVAQVRTPGTILSTNTSGIPLASIAASFPQELRRHFLGTHFFKTASTIQSHWRRRPRSSSKLPGAINRIAASVKNATGFCLAAFSTPASAAALRLG